MNTSCRLNRMLMGLVSGSALLTLGIVISARANTPACPNAPGSVPQGHRQVFPHATCEVIQDCAANSARCNSSPCSRCSGPNTISYCKVSANPEIGECIEVESGCGLCHVGGTCDMITGTCSGGMTRDADEDGFQDICYVRKCD